MHFMWMLLNQWHLLLKKICPFIICKISRFDKWNKFRPAYALDND
ncbi:hypothetical protein [Paenibacillus riograndensis]|nr:hypothetical protein [Paenibacillus riograndensis]